MHEFPIVSPRLKTEAPKPCGEYLFSIAIIAKGTTSEIQKAVRAAALLLERKAEFFEIILLVSVTEYDRNMEAFNQLFGLRNLRSLILRDGTGEYRTAIFAATESIGDFALIVLADEYEVLDLEKIYDTVVETGASVRLREARRAGPVTRILARLLSLISGYRVDPQLLRSAAFHRSHIERIASRADREIALRFAPREGWLSEESTTLEVEPTRRRASAHPIYLKFGMAMEILANSPPSILRFLAMLSFFVSLCAILFFVYAICLFLFGFPLQPGWLSTSVAISGSTAFAGLLFGAISTALYQILSKLRNDTGDEIVREMNNTDLFRDYSRINVETLVSK